MSMSFKSRIKKFTSIILIIAMVMTSGGISSFANSVDDVVNTTASNEKEKSSSRKYFDEEEKSDDLIEDEEMMEEADSEEENSDEENSDSQDGESEEPESEEEFGPWREGDSRNEGEHDEEPEEESENETIDKSDENEDDGRADESKQIEDGETEVDSSSAFDGENTAPADGEVDTENASDDADNTSTASDADYAEEELITVEKNASPSEVEEITVERNASPSEIEEITVERNASPSEIDELITVEKKASPSEATPSEIEEIITVATDSEIFVVATESIIPLEATSSDMKLMGGDTNSSAEQEVPAIVVWGDVGYNGGSHVNNGHLGMYIGGYDDYGHGQEHGGIKNRNGGKVGLHYSNKNKGNLHELMKKKFADRDEFMIAPQFFSQTGWYVQARGRFADDAIGSQFFGDVLANHYKKNKREEKSWTDIELRRVWQDFLKVPFKSYGTDARGVNLEYKIRKDGGDFSILNNNQNIRGYKVTKVHEDGTYDVELIENVKFNNNWAMYEKESTSSWHIEKLDDEITTHSNGDEEYDWTTRFNTAYYGIHVTEAKGTAKTKVVYDTNGKGSGWKSGAQIKKLYATMDENASYTITVPKDDKDVKWTDKDGKEYKLQGWVLYDQQVSADASLYNVEQSRARAINETPIRTRYKVNIRRPGETFTLKPAKDWGNRRWPVTFGPFYRDTNSGSDVREGLNYGLADQGPQLRDTYSLDFSNDKRVGKNGSKSSTFKWFMITKAERMRDEWKSGKGDNRAKVGSVQYNTIFYAPVLAEVKDREATLDLNGGSWVKSGSSNTIKFSNFETKSLPGASDVKKTGYAFDGWYTAKDGGDKITSLGSPEIEKGITKLYAHWTAKKYNIVIKNRIVKANTLDVSSGKPSFSEKSYGNETDLKTYSNVSYDGEIQLPAKYDLEGFNFVGFNQNKNNLTKSWDGNAKVKVSALTLNESGNTYIYPIYKEKQASVLLSGSEITASDKTKKTSNYSTTVTFNYYGGLELPTPTELTGFNFDYWEASRVVNKKTETKKFAAKDTTLKFRDYLDWVSFSSTVTFKAKWKEKEYKIEFKGGKATGSDAVSYSSDSSKTETFKYYSKIKIPTDFTLTDFTLSGFGKEKNGSSVFLAKNADVTAGSKSSNLSETGTNTLYGRWKEDEINVIFNGGSIQASDGKVKTSSSKSEKKVKLKSKVEIPQEFKLTGFNFKGFNKADKASSVTLELTDTNKKKATELVKDYKDKDGNLSFYGVWSEKKYNLAIDAGSKEANGKIYKGTGSIAAKVYGYYSNVSMPTDEKIKMPGFTLRGFNKEDQQESVKYEPDAVVDVSDLVEYLSMKEHTVENATPSKLYAAWDIAGGTIKFDAGVGYFKDEKREKTLKPDKMGKALNEYEGYEEPAETDDYKFSHWEDKDGNKYYGTTVLIGSIELSAKYQNKPKEEEVKVPTYTIQINNDDSKGTYTGPESFTLRIGDNILASMSEAKIENPTANKGYTFVGWSFDGQNLIGFKDLYTDNTKTEIKAVYIELTITITLSSAEGQFRNGEKVKNLISTKSMALEEHKDYEEPTREGYNFKDWQNGATIVISKDEITVDTSLVARYKSIGGTEEPEKPAEYTTYTISIINNSDYGTYTGPNSFDISLGAIVRSIMQNYNIKDPKPNDDKVFLGWSWDGNKDNILGSSETYTNSNNRSLEAVYADKTYKVILSAGDGEFADGTKSKELTSNEKVALNAFTNYEEPTKEGYVFKRWMSGGVEVASTSIITEDMTIFANFAKVNEEGGTEEPETPETTTTYTISVSNDDSKGTYNGSTSFEIALGSVILSSMSEAGVVEPVAFDNYKFLGWSWDGNKDNLIKDTDTYVDTTLKTVSAVYDEKTYTVVLSAGDGEFTGGLKSKEITSKEKVALNTFTNYEEPTKVGYVFRRWTKGGVEVASTSVIESDMTLVANFARVIPEGEVVEDNTKYTIAILNDDVAGKYTGPTSFELAIGNIILASMSEAGVVDPTANENYNFLGWSWNGNKDNLVKATDKYLDITLATISSVYSQDTYTVTLNGGEGVFADGKKTKEIKSHSKISLGEFTGYEVPVRDEYEFMRWLDKDGVEVATTSVITNDIVLFASYKKIAEDITDTRYTVTISNDSEKGVIKVKGVEKESASFKINLGVEVLVALASASITAEAKEGYVFKGWSWSGDIATLIQVGDKYNDNRNTSLKAVYTKSTEKTVVLKANTGVFMSTGARTLTLVSESAAKTLESFDKYEEPVKEDATFDRWVKEDGAEFAKSNVVTTDLVLTAVYKDKDGNDIGVDDETKDGGEDATYTVVIKSEAAKGTLSNATKKTIDGVEYYVAVIDVKTGDKILDKLEEKGLTVEADEEKWIYEGWSKTNDKNGLLDSEDVFDDKSVTTINAIFYKTVHIAVLLNANTGIFKETGERTKKVTSDRKVELGDFKGYEEPVKSEGYKFIRWEDKDENKYELTHEFGEELDSKTIELFAIYTDENGNIVGRGESKDEGSKATYTVYTKYDENKATHKKSSFEVAKDGLVIEAMKDYDAYEAVEVEGWWEKGWSFDNTATNLINDKTIYDDTTKTYIYAQYVDTNKWTIVLNANTGLFSDNKREKVLENTKKVEIENFEGYEVPSKSQGFTFDRWEDKDGNVYKATDFPPDPFDLVLYAIYKDKNGKDVGKDDKNAGGKNATYTIKLSSDDEKGDIGAVKTFEIAIGDNVVATMSNAGVKEPTGKGDNYFIGWSWDEESYDKVITSESVYKGDEGNVLYALYSNELFEVTIKANTGIFSSDNSREKVLQVPKFQLLKANSGYEVPVKANATFNRWLKNDAIIGEIDTYKIMESQTLEATYRANDGSNDNIGKDSDTKDGGENATYTIRIVNDNNFGDYRGSEYFEIKKGEVIFTTMKEAGVTEGLGKPGYTFRGWRLGSEYISATTIYEDTENTTLYIDYSNQTFELTLDASVGRFKDKSKIKVLNVAKGRVINTIKDYEEPIKESWTFNRWLNGEVEVASTSTLPYDISAMTLTARYLNKEGKEVNEDSHKHLECGATDETASHAFDVISNHDREIAYLPVSNKEEFMDYIVDEMAKDETDRSDIRLYLEENIELDDEILLDGATNLYICLNGYTLTSREFGNRNNESGNIFFTNCKEDEAAIVQTATDSNLAKTFFGTNDLHILSAKGKINVKPLNRLVEVSGGAGLFPKVIELMNAKVSGNKEIAIDRLIKAEGYSSIRLVDVDISDVNLTDTLIASYEGSELVFGGQINLTNNFTHRAIVETRDVFSLMDNATLNISNNTILKNENGNVAIIFIGGVNNYLGGHLLVRDNKLELSEEYKKLVNAKPAVEEKADDAGEDDKTDDNDDLTNDDDLYGAYDEEVSPAGEVGYASAVAFTKENISLDVGNAKIEIYGNESVASDSNVRAEYMYQLRALSNTSNPLIRQKSGTALSDDSVIGIAFATEDGEGVLTNSAKIGKEVFVNKTFGKEEKLLNIKDNAGNLELARKTYSVVYDEGTPTTREQKLVIDPLFADGSTISEATRVRSIEVKAGHDIQLEGDDIYRAKGFDLATYSLVNKNNVKLGQFIPSATVSYVESLFGDGVDIEDGDEIKAVSNYKEKELKSEAKEPIVITKEDYDKVVNEVVSEAVTSAASKSVADQAVVDSEENYYTVRYHLEGGHIDGAKDNGLNYFDDERINRKVDYTLISNISKVATESGVRREYDFISWHEKNDEGEIDDSPIPQISANTFEGELLEVYAEYLPSTYKITYHLDGGKLAGYEEDGDTVEDTINRNQDYILLRGVTKDDFAFTGWRVDMDGYITNATELSKGTVSSDVEAYAEYRTALYEVTYNLNGGSIRNLTDEESDTYVDSKANMLYDYYLPQDVTKRGYKFTGWETANGVKVDVIPAGDNDESKRSVVATFAPTTWKIIYDTDGGTITGYPEGNITDNVTEDMEYVLYTDVVKEGYKFEYWYDVSQPTRKIDVIKSAAGGSEFRVKAKYSPLTYSLKLHIDEDAFIVNINGIKSDEAYELPTDITVDNKEFVNWNYVDAKGAPVFIKEIEAGNPKKITDVYANYEDLMTWKIVYHLGPNEFIKDETDYDATSTAEEKTKTIIVNRRQNTALYDNVIKTDVAVDNNITAEVDVFGSGDMGAAKKYEFYGWTKEKAEPNSLGDKAYESIYKLVSAVTKETEESEIKSGKAYSKTKEWHYYPYFEEAISDTVEVTYHFENGGSLPGMRPVDGKYTETVKTYSLLSLSVYYMLSAYNMVDGYTFGGIYKNENFEGEQVRTIGPEELKHAAETDGKLDLYVKFKKTKYNLTYHLNGGNIKGRTVAADDTKFETSFDNTYVTYLLASVERKGYAFTGWRVSNEEDAEVVKQIDRGVEKDIELYASWKRDSYTVNYMLNGGRVSGKANKDFSETYSNSKTNELISNVTKSGANFLGWYTEKNGKGEKIEKIEASETPLEDLTVYAFYESTLYTVNYYANGGKIRGLNADPYVRIYDGKDHITLFGGEDVIKEGGQFFKWVDEDGTEFKDIPAGHKGNLNLYAIYLFGSVDITFDIGNRGTLKGSKAKNGKVTRTYGKGDDIVLPTMGDFNWPETRKNSKSGETFEEYYFAGWYTDKNYKGKKIEVIPAGNPDNITELYAKWEFAPYIITYHLNGGTIAGLSRSNEIDESIDIMSKVKAYELPKDVTRADAKFLGWYEDKNLKVGPVTKLSANPKQMKDGTVHLYAKWEKEVIYVYYNCYLKNDFRPKSDRVRFDVDNTVTYLLEDEKGSLLKGYVSSDVEFDGWFLEKDANNQGTGQEVYSIGKDVKDDVELYARFVRISDMSINEYYRFSYRKMDRESKLKQEKWKRDRELVELANDIQRQILADLTGGNTGAIEHIIKNYYGSVTSTESKEETQIEEVDETKTKNKAFGGLFDPLRKLFGDDDSEEPKAGDPEDEEEIVVNISDLLAYDTVSAERLGLETPKGTKLDCIFITSITDSEGNSVADTRFVGQMLKAGSNFSDLAEAYPGHLFGMRPVFVDEKVYEKPKQPNDDYYDEGGRGGRGGRGGSGGSGGGRGNTAGKKPATYDAITVNPYGFDGIGSDNGAARANILKADINNRLGRTATLSAIEYKTIDVLDKDNVFAGLTAETWEYFPASNNFKLFLNAPNHERYYITNGWYACTFNEQKIWYKFDEDGIMQRGFVEDGGKVYYLNNSLNELGYMVTGYKDFEGTGYTGYFGADGALVSIFQTSDRASYEGGLSALPKEANFDRAKYELCKKADKESTRIVSTDKVAGQCALGNFVGYWYNLASGQRKFRFETINNNLQVVKFATDGWMNIYDANNTLYSYRFDSNANVVLNTITPDGLIVGSDGHLIGTNILLDFNIAGILQYNTFALATTTLNTLPVTAEGLKSLIVGSDGVPLEISPATDIWTNINFEGPEPLLSNKVYGAISLVVPQLDTPVEPIQLLSNAVNTVSNVMTINQIDLEQLGQIDEVIPIIDPVGIMKPLNIVKMTKVLVNWILKRA